jgi:hypothetical protein
MTFEDILKIGKRLSPLVKQFGKGILCLMPKKITDAKIRSLPLSINLSEDNYNDVTLPVEEYWELHRHISTGWKRPPNLSADHHGMALLARSALVHRSSTKQAFREL